MATYINPDKGTKEEFILNFGTLLSLEDMQNHNFEEFKNNDKYVIVWLNNGPFTDVLICDCEREYKYMLDALPTEKRQYEIYFVPIEKLQPYL